MKYYFLWGAFTFAGAFLASLVPLFVTENPCRFPPRIVIPRALGGLLYFWAAWTPLAWFLSAALSTGLWPILDTNGLTVSRYVVGFLFGLLLPPSIGTFKDEFFTLNRVRKNTFYRILFKGAQALDQNTRLYVQRIMIREERKADSRFFGSCQDEEEAERAVSTVWNDHAPVMADEDQDDGVLKIQHPHVRFKRLLYHLGYTELLALLSEALISEARVPPEAS